MLIGIDSSRSLRAQRTGTERYALEITRHLLALPSAANHRWRLYVDHRLSAQEQNDLLALSRTEQVEVCVLPARRMWTHRALAQEVWQNPPDVLFVPAHVIPFAPLMRRLPQSVVTVHDLGYRFHPKTHTLAQRLYLRWSTWWSARAATRIIAISQATASDLLHLHNVPAAKLRIVYESVPEMRVADISQSERNRVCAKYAIAQPYALYVGTIQPRKNLERLMQAYERLHGRARGTGKVLPWNLVLAGAKGWLSDALCAEAQRLGVQEHVHFPGYIDDEDLPALMSGAQFFCFPSLFEGFGLPVLEAQLCGVPVMTSNNSSLPEIAGNAALLVDPLDVDAIADAMLRLSTDEALRQQLIAAGNENLKRFSWQKAAAETLAVLEEAAAGE